VLFVVQPDERNIMDQRLIELELWDKFGVRARRTTLKEISATASLHDYALMVPGDEAGVLHEISVVYYRAGYSPVDYPSDVEWSGRALAESSKAIKCPDIAYHLCGTKKVQQVLASPGQLERFVPDEAKRELLRSCFAGLWSLDATDATPNAAKVHPHAYVIKPQREGGGNNIYNAAVGTALNGGMDAATLSAHILMERIFPAVEPTVFVKAGVAHPGKAVCEMGVYGVFLGDGHTTHVNVAVGHLLRTKAEDTDEGGVAAGFAVLDSPLLC
jgi:glutathione synthetase